MKHICNISIVMVGLAMGSPTDLFAAPLSDPRLPSKSDSTNVAATGLAKERQVVLETAQGKMTIELFPEVAPKTVAHFLSLARQGFYNGLSFYRVVPKFLIQTGDPLADGTGGSGHVLPAEFNDKKHVVGTVGMARQREPDSADSQFYICLEPQPFLDGKYTVFGQVTEGLDVLPKIREGETIRNLAPKS